MRGFSSWKFQTIDSYQCLRQVSWPLKWWKVTSSYLRRLLEMQISLLAKAYPIHSIIVASCMIFIPRSLNTFSQRNDPWIKTTGLSQVGPSFQNEGGTTSVPFTSVYVARSFAELGGVQIGLIEKVASYACYAHDSWYLCLFRSWLQPAWMNANAYIYIYMSHCHTSTKKCWQHALWTSRQAQCFADFVSHGRMYAPPPYQWLHSEEQRCH